MQNNDNWRNREGTKECRGGRIDEWIAILEIAC